MRRLVLERRAHEAHPDRQGHGAAVFAAPQAFRLVETGPYGGHVVGVVAGEPGILGLVGGTGLARHAVTGDIAVFAAFACGVFLENSRHALGDIFGDDLTLVAGISRFDNVAVAVQHAVHDVRLHKVTAVCHGSNGRDHLNRCDRKVLSERRRCKLDDIELVFAKIKAVCFAGQVDADLAMLLRTIAIVAVLGLMSGSIMDNYSNGLALLSFGVKLPRTAAAGLTAALTVAGVVYVTFFSDTFLPSLKTTVQVSSLMPLTPLVMTLISPLDRLESSTFLVEKGTATRRF